MIDSKEEAAIGDAAARELLAYGKKLIAPKWYEKAPINETLAVGLMAVIMIVSLEHIHDGELVQAHQDGVAVGYKLGQADLTETMTKKVTDKTCMSWWFNGDSERVGKAIQKVAIK